MKILVADGCYVSSDKTFSVFFIRGRNIYYKHSGIDVCVLDFSATRDLLVDDIPVISYKSYKKNYSKDRFDMLICHAPNIRNHYFFLKKHSDRFQKIVFFFHGHEVLRTSQVYPRPYPFVNESAWCRRTFVEIYDLIKLRMWRKYFSKLAPKSHFVFVSPWMYREFLKWVGIDQSILRDKISITYNAVGDLFEKNSYIKPESARFDFMTVRGNIDGSKYCIDLVTRIAERYPQYKFCIVGKGRFFEFNEMPSNITWIDKHLDHHEIIEYLNKSLCALMPTRADSQGLMACEMATYGIPVITSDIPVCHEIFEGFNNVGFIDNNDFSKDFEAVFEELARGIPYEKNRRYFAKYTCDNEVQLFRRLLKAD